MMHLFLVHYGAFLMEEYKSNRVIRANHGKEKQAKSWLTEAALRMLCNNLDPDVAEDPDSLIVYGRLRESGSQLGVFQQDC